MHRRLCRASYVSLLIPGFSLAILTASFVGRSEAATLYSTPGPITVNDNGVGSNLPGMMLSRGTTASDVVYFRFVVKPLEDYTNENYFGGLELYEGGSERLGVGNAYFRLPYSAFITTGGDVDLNSETPEVGQSYQYPRTTDQTRIIVKVQYVSGGVDHVTVWLNPNLGRSEVDQPAALTTTFDADASFDEIHLREGFGMGGGGWTFSDIAVASSFDDLRGYSTLGPITVNDNGVGSNLPGMTLSRGSTDSDVVYFRFAVKPLEDYTNENYFAGLELYEGGTERLGVGNAYFRLPYSAFQTTGGDVDLNSATPEAGQSYQYVRTTDQTRIIVKVQYVSGGADHVTVWLNPDLGLSEANQPAALTTTFDADASFDEIRLREGFGMGGGGWTFSDIAVASSFGDWRGVVAVGDAPGPRVLELSPSKPNPFTISTRIGFALPRAASVRLTIHDVQGRQVAMLAQGARAAGRHEASWDGRDTRGARSRAGMYFVRLVEADANGEETRVRKIVLTR